CSTCGDPPFPFDVSIPNVRVDDTRLVGVPGAFSATPETAVGRFGVGLPDRRELFPSHPLGRALTNEEKDFTLQSYWYLLDNAGSPFALFFIGVVLATAVSLGWILIPISRRKYSRALSLLRRLAVALGVYLGIVVLVSVVSDRREVQVGDRQCWDDWCLA